MLPLFPPLLLLLSALFPLLLLAATVFLEHPSSPCPRVTNAAEAA
jgi:hypothetical protein